MAGFEEVLFAIAPFLYSGDRYLTFLRRLWVFLCHSMQRSEHFHPVGRFKPFNRLADLRF